MKCECECHRPGSSIMHFSPCCQGECPVCGQAQHQIREHVLAAHLDTPEYESARRDVLADLLRDTKTLFELIVSNQPVPFLLWERCRDLRDLCEQHSGTQDFSKIHIYTPLTKKRRKKRHG